MDGRSRILFFLLLMSISESILAGAWVQKTGEGLNILTYRRYLSAQYWTPSGHLAGSPQYAKTQADNYLEYGLTERLTIGGFYSALRTRTAANGIRGGSMDHLVLARYRLWQNDNNVLSLQVFANKFGRAARFDVPPQNSNYSTYESLWYGRSGQIKTKYPINWFVDGGLGLVQRYGLGGQISLILEGGLKFNDDKFWIFLQNYGIGSLSHLTKPHNSDYNISTIAPSILYWFNKSIALQMGFAQDYYGQNVGKGSCPLLSCWIKF